MQPLEGVDLKREQEQLSPMTMGKRGNALRSPLILKWAQWTLPAVVCPEEAKGAKVHRQALASTFI